MNTFKIFLILLSISITAMGCGKKEDPDVSEKTEKLNKDTSVTGTQSSKNVNSNQSDFPPVTLDFKTKTGKIYLVILKKNSESSFDIMISGIGFENSTDTIFHKESNPYEKTLIADLDGNGFDDMIVITRSAGSGSYSGIYGVASNNDKSFTPVNIPSLSEADMQPGKPFEGYMGHDYFNLENNVLVREFPVYKSTDTNADPTGGKRKIYYKLSPGEAMYQLEIDRVEDVK